MSDKADGTSDLDSDQMSGTEVPDTPLSCTSTGSQPRAEPSPLQRRLLNSIQQIRSAGSFAASAVLQNFPLPGISVTGIGEIHLPLSIEHAGLLIRESRQAPFGKGDQTVVDEAVRKTWEIDRGRVSFSNTAWHSWLDTVVKLAVDGLGVVGSLDNVKVELDKMLIYEKGAMFKPHKDTEKTPGHIATLIICLPSLHTGGKVYLRHGTKEKTFSTAEVSGFQVTYMAWYADVCHEIREVLSGYRWVITYKITNTSSVGPDRSAAVLDLQNTRFRAALAEWHSRERPEGFCFALDHQYTNAGLTHVRMKGADYYRVANIANSCMESGNFYVFLANLQKTVEVSNNAEAYGLEEDVELSLHRISFLDGYVIKDSLRIANDCLLQPDLYYYRDHDEQTGGEYMGNEHASFERRYNDSALLIVRKESATNYLLGRGHTLEHFKSLLDKLQSYSTTRDENGHARSLIIQACRNHLMDNHGRESKDSFLGQIAVTAAAIADSDLFRDAVSLVDEGFDEEIFCTLGKLSRYIDGELAIRKITETQLLKKTILKTPS